MIGKDNIVAKVVEAGGKLTVKSALNPILWLCAIITIPGLVIVPIVGNTPTWLIFLILSPVYTAILGFLFLLLFDRDKLQSEEYQLKKRSLEISGEKGEDPKIIETELVDITENPELEGSNEQLEEEK